MRMGFLVSTMLATVAVATAAFPRTMKDLTFLTRDGCVNTPEMLNNFHGALKALGLPNDYRYIDIGTLPNTDVRTGYPTPTLLWKGRDTFGMPAPKPPFQAPS